MEDEQHSGSNSIRTEQNSRTVMSATETQRERARARERERERERGGGREREKEGEREREKERERERERVSNRCWDHGRAYTALAARQRRGRITGWENLVDLPRLGSGRSCCSI